MNERTTIKRTIYPQGHLAGLFRLKEELTRRVNLGASVCQDDELRVGEDLYLPDPSEVRQPRVG